MSSCTHFSWLVGTWVSCHIATAAFSIVDQLFRFWSCNSLFPVILLGRFTTWVKLEMVSSVIRVLFVLMKLRALLLYFYFICMYGEQELKVLYRLVGTSLRNFLISRTMLLFSSQRHFRRRRRSWTILAEEKSIQHTHVYVGLAYFVQESESGVLHTTASLVGKLHMDPFA